MVPKPLQNLASKCTNTHNVSIIFVNNTFIWNTRTFWHRKLYMKTCYNSKSLWILTILLVWFFLSHNILIPTVVNLCVRRLNQEYILMTYNLCLTSDFAIPQVKTVLKELKSIRYYGPNKFELNTWRNRI